MINISLQGFIVIASICFGLLIVACLLMFIKIDDSKLKEGFIKKIIIGISTFMKEQDDKMQDQLFKGQTQPLMKKWNVFLNSLKIDISFCEDMKLVQFKWFLYFISFVLGIVVSLILFRNIIAIPFMAAAMLALIICIVFSKTTKKRYFRILQSIEAENMLSSDIKGGFIVAVKRYRNNIPDILKKPYMAFVQNVEEFNHPKEKAIEILNMDTGGYSQEFLANVLVWEKFHTEGFDRIFEDTQELNNMRVLARDEMEAVMKKISLDFTLSFIASFGAFVFCLVTMPVFRRFYFNTVPGQVLFVINLLILLVIYIYISVLKATEL